ncbi:hypothetical protein [Pseudomonas edaphica]|uniref:hypothetical protein n=1 Tax=Pseudomonas edaphica TaxID=2006980 RepID=UPI003D124F18
MASPIGLYLNEMGDNLTILHQHPDQSVSGSYTRYGESASGAYNFSNVHLNGSKFVFTGTVPPDPRYGIVGGEEVSGDFTFSPDFTSLQGTLLVRGYRKNFTFKKMADTLDNLGNPITGAVIGAYRGVVRGLPVTLTIGGPVEPQPGTAVSGPSTTGTLVENGVTYSIQGPISRDYISFTVYNYRDGKSHWGGSVVDWSCNSLNIFLDGDGGAVEGPFVLTRS